MKLPLDDKPSLKELFDSKKFDQPDSEFWDSFQDEVRSKTLSSVVTQKVGPSITKIAFMCKYFNYCMYGILPLIFLLVENLLNQM